jgi:hypothetical protein
VWIRTLAATPSRRRSGSPTYVIRLDYRKLSRRGVGFF